MTQETRLAGATVIAYGSWAGAVALTVLRVRGDVGTEASAVILLLVGCAMAAGISLSRMRLTATMLAVFEAGMIAARKQNEEMEARLTADDDDT